MENSEKISLESLEEMTSLLVPILEEISEIKKLIPEKRYHEITKKLEDYNLQ